MIFRGCLIDFHVVDCDGIWVKRGLGEVIKRAKAREIYECATSFTILWGFGLILRKECDLIRDLKLIISGHG